MSKDPTKRWTIQDALEAYGIPYWGKGYFDVADSGHLTVHPDKTADRSLDMKDLVDQLAEEGIHPPVLMRFSGILEHRLGEIAQAFRGAIEENGYRGDYRCVYPIKVNQQRHVVEEICQFGTEHGFGLEAGSKPELLAVLPLTMNRDVPVICNGFKDDEFIEMVILAQKIGHRVLPVVEKPSELRQIVKYAEKHSVEPKFGIRVKLAARGSGRWELSGGLRSKFGLFIPEVLEALSYLEERGMSHCLTLLHFHLGSQITNIRRLKNAINELARIYVQLKKAGAGLTTIDIGGGLGVDYDGSQTNFASSINYTLTEYASDAVSRIMNVCDEAEVEHPLIITESGRALVAHHAVLVFDVVGTSRFDRLGAPPLPSSEELENLPQPLIDLWDRLQDIRGRNCIEYFHDALQSYDEAMNLFNLGHLDLALRSDAERLFWAILTKVRKLTTEMDRVPEDLQSLPDFLSDTYFCNFSLFQSMPDSWAVGQLFPVAPLHRLNERPTRRGVLGDITCDSDGKIDKFTDLRNDKRALELHAPDGSPYHLGAFLVGAYQEILGDLHNLLGDTHAVHISIGEDGSPEIRHLVPGDTVREVLGYVQFSADRLLEQMRVEVGRGVEEMQISMDEADLLLSFYEAGLDGYTYLEEE